MATKRRKKSPCKARVVKKVTVTRTTKKRARRAKKDLLNKLLDFLK